MQHYTCGSTLHRGHFLALWTHNTQIWAWPQGSNFTVTGSSHNIHWRHDWFSTDGLFIASPMAEADLGGDVGTHVFVDGHGSLAHRFSVSALYILLVLEIVTTVFYIIVYDEHSAYYTLILVVPYYLAWRIRFTLALIVPRPIAYYDSHTRVDIIYYALFNLIPHPKFHILERTSSIMIFAMYTGPG